MKIVSKFFWGLLFLLGAALAINALTYLNFDPEYGFLKIKSAAVASGKYLPFYYLHVLFGGLILMAGFVQVSKWFRSKWLTIHRKVGYFYVMGILFLAAPGGLGAGWRRLWPRACGCSCSRRTGRAGLHIRRGRWRF